jgi:large subunit ribosomal protein L5e
MVFIKVYKTKAYFKRFQTRFRRRREGKTDYYARKRLIIQDKNKYNSHKYRFVPRITNSKVVCQVIYATIQGDRVLCHAQSTELKKYGLTAGLTNYATCYATGLLCARRLLHTTGLDKLYAGAKAINGENYDVEKEATGKDKRPFKAFMDVGLVRATTGNRIFGCLKGAVDGGLHIPHSNKRFPGFKKEGDKETYNAKVHRSRIFGEHISAYMKKIKGEAETYKKQFRIWDECLKKANVESVDKLYAKIHDEIKKNPIRGPKVAKKAVPQKWADKDKTIVETAKGKYKIERRLTNAQRKKRVEQKIAKALKAKK